MALVEQHAALIVPDKEALDCGISTALRLIESPNDKTMLSRNIAKLAIPDSAERVVEQIVKLYNE